MQKKMKIIAIVLIFALAASTVAAIAPYFASYTRTISWTAANTQFEVDVNGTQIGQTTTLNIGATSSADSYCEVYKLTNQGDVPITITGSLTSASGATFAWQTASVVTLGPLQSFDMVLLINNFAGAGSVTVHFNSVKAFIDDPMVFEFKETVTNDADSSVGNGAGSGYWALDNYVKDVQVWSLGHNNYVALVNYIGTFTTFGTGLGPQGTGTETHPVTGTMIGGYAATFSATAIGTPLSTYTKDLGGTTIGNANPWDWTAAFLTPSGGTGFNQYQWGWTYLYSTSSNAPYSGQMWNNQLTGNNGNIVA
jgi:hypothetical protein